MQHFDRTAGLVRGFSVLCFLAIACAAAPSRAADISAPQLKPSATFAAGEYSPSCVAFSPDGKLVAAGYAVGDPIQIFHFPNGKRAAVCQDEIAAAGMAWSPDGKWIAIHHVGAAAFLQPADGGKLVKIPDSDDHQCVAFDRFSGDVLLGTYDIAKGGAIKFINPKTLKLTQTPLECGHVAVASIDISTDGSKLAAGVISPQDESAAQIWDLRQGELLETLPAGKISDASPVFIPSVRFTADGKHLVYRTSDSGFCTWDLQSHRKLIDMTGPAKMDYAAISPDGRFAAGVVLGDKAPSQAFVWDTTTGKPMFALSNLAEAAGIPEFSPDSTTLVVGSEKNLLLFAISKTAGKIPAAPAPAVAREQSPAPAAAQKLAGNWEGKPEADETALHNIAINGGATTAEQIDAGVDQGRAMVAKMTFKFEFTPDGKCFSTATGFDPPPPVEVDQWKLVKSEGDAETIHMTDEHGKEEDLVVKFVDADTILMPLDSPVNTPFKSPITLKRVKTEDPASTKARNAAAQAAPAPAAADVPLPAAPELSWGVAPLSAKPGQAPRDLMLAWVSQNNNFGAGAPVVNDVKTIAEQAESAGKDYSMLLGPGMVKSGRATELASYQGRLYVIEYSESQTKAAKLADRSAIAHQSIKDGTSDPAEGEIASLTFDHPRQFNFSRSITGSVSFKDFAGQVDNCALRLRFIDGPNASSTYGHFAPGTKLDETSRKFSLPPLPRVKARGPQVVFVDVVRFPEGGQGDPHSISTPIAIVIDTALTALR